MPDTVVELVDLGTHLFTVSIVVEGCLILTLLT